MSKVKDNNLIFYLILYELLARMSKEEMFCLVT